MKIMLETKSLIKCVKQKQDLVQKLSSKLRVDSNQKTRVTKEMKRKKVMKMESIKTTKKMKKVTIISDMSKYFLKFNFTPYYCIIIN